MSRSDSSRNEAAQRLAQVLPPAAVDVLLADAEASSGTPIDGPDGLLAQIAKSVLDRNHGAISLINHIHRRARNYAVRTGQTAYEVGDREALLRIQERAPLPFIRFATIIAQPGLSIAASTDKQMRLLAGAESYVKAVTKGTFGVYRST